LHYTSRKSIKLTSIILSALLMSTSCTTTKTITRNRELPVTGPKVEWTSSPRQSVRYKLEDLSVLKVVPSEQRSCNRVWRGGPPQFIIEATEEMGFDARKKASIKVRARVSCRSKGVRFPVASVDLGDMPPGSKKLAKFSIQVPTNFKGTERLKISVDIQEDRSRFAKRESIKLTLGRLLAALPEDEGGMITVPPVEGPKGRRIMVYVHNFDFKGFPASRPNSLKTLASALTYEVQAVGSKNARYQVLTQQNLEEMIKKEKRKALLLCTDRKCLNRIVENYGCSQKILGSVKMISNTYIQVILVLVEGSDVLKTVGPIYVSSPDPKEITGAVRVLAAEMFGLTP
jgi:hypothetical protein